MTVALAIPTAADWIPARTATLDRLLTALGTSIGPRQIFRERCHFTKWADDVWRFLEDSGMEWGLQLQDDVIPAPNFWKALGAMLTGVPADAEIICLESAHPSTPLLHAAGEPWYTTTEMMIGVGWVVRREVLTAFREWRETKLRPGAWFPGPQCVTEDTLFGIFAMLTGRRIWCPTRTILDHDVEILSTNGPTFDAHPNRRPRVRWDNAGIPLHVYEDPLNWRRTSPPPHLGCGYGMGSVKVAARWVEGFTETDGERFRADDGKLEIRRLLGHALTLGREVDLCCLCGRHVAAVRGMTGLQACPGCIGGCVSTLLSHMKVS